MKKIEVLICLSIFLFISACGSKKSEPAPLGFVAKVQLDEDIEGLCDSKNVYSLSPFFGANQIAAKCASSQSDWAKKINAECAFLQENPDHNDKGMLGLFISCTGELVQVSIDNKTSSPELDSQLEDILASFDQWEAGKYNGENVDSHVLASFEISKGKISFK